jgi:hypothetical protein
LFTVASDRWWLPSLPSRLPSESYETRSVPGGEELRALQRLLQLGDLAAGAASWASVFGSRSTNAIRQSGKTVKSE